MFIDDILKQYPEIPKPEAIFRLQNVADYIYSCPSEYKNYEETLPSMTPPFKYLFAEFISPNKLNINGKIRETHFTFPCGIFVITEMNEMPSSDIVFTTTKVFFFNYHKKIIRHGAIRKYLNKNGQLVINNKTGYPIDFIFNKDLPEATRAAQNKEFDFIDLGFADLIIDISFAFLHCKNVVQIENNFEPKLIKARQKRNKPYFEKYYTLQVDSIKKILDNEGQLQTKGLKHALHICRGHFKTYEAKGLFGKYKGTFWWPSHLKGHSDIGKIEKDYEIKAKDLSILQ